MVLTQHKLAALAFAFVGLVWGSNVVFMTLASQQISPMQIVFLRVLFGFLPRSTGLRLYSANSIRRSDSGLGREESSIVSLC